MRVIIATDGSIEADIARAVLKRLPLPSDAKMTVAMATHLPALVAVGFTPESAMMADRAAADTWKIQRQVARQTVDRVAESIKSEGFNAEGVVLEGNTADQLLDLITKEGADAVVAGCGVNSNFAAFFLGSVSRKLVLYSGASVLIGRHYADQKAEDSYQSVIQKDMLDLVVAVDGTKGADLAVESLSHLERPAFDNVYLVAVDQVLYPVVGADPALYMPSLGSEKAEVEKTAREAADRVRNSGKSVHVVTAFGRPSAEICRIAKEKDADVIMLGANRHGALERFLVGSCAYETATSAPCSVLILRDALPFTSKR